MDGTTGEPTIRLFGVNDVAPPFSLFWLVTDNHRREIVSCVMSLDFFLISTFLHQ